MNEKELQNKIDEYCNNRSSCKDCIFNNANIGCIDTDTLKFLQTLEKFKKEVLRTKIISLEFELLDDGYKLITEDTTLKGIVFNTKDLTYISFAEETQAKLEYIFYKARNKKEKKI